MEFIPRFFELSDRSCFLFGPRGTGKSLWLRHHCSEGLFVDLLDPAEIRPLMARPERLAERVTATPPQHPIIIDEVQKIPELLPVVHKLISEDPERRFVLSGSSARKLKRRGVNLLGGRAVRRSMHPFMAAELGDRFSLEGALRMGTLPVVLAAPDPKDVIRAYVSLYVKEEVQAEGLTRKLGAFHRFLEAISFSHGCPLNVSSVARECHVERKTVESFLDILEDLLLAWRVPVFSKRAQRAVTVHPKLYLFDAGVFRSLRPAGPLDRPEEIDGAALEGLVAQHLRAWIGYGHPDSQLFYWRTRGGSEVDFVIYGPGQFWAVEVKNAASIRPADLRGLRTFGQDYPSSRRILLYRGDKRLLRDDVNCIPCSEFLLQLRPDQALLP